MVPGCERVPYGPRMQGEYFDLDRARVTARQAFPSILDSFGKGSSC